MQWNMPQRKGWITFAMVVISVWPCCFSAIGDEGAAPPKKETQAFSPLTIGLSKVNYMGGEPVILSVKWKNDSPNTAELMRIGVQLEITVTSGPNKLPLTLQGQRSSPTNNPSELVRAGKEGNYNVVISRLFDVSLGTSYKVIVKRWLVKPNQKPGGSEGVFLVSNEVAFNVESRDVAP